MLTEHKTLDELAGEIATALGDLDPAGQRLAIALYRLLAAGRPVAAADLAAAADLPESEVAGALDGWPAVFTDSRGRITGFWGLAVTELSPAHRYESGGRVLYAWCAWDTLFLPARLGQAARVTSACPVTGEPIELTVIPEGISGTSHPAVVVSFLRPGRPFDSGVIESFCHFVHFFAGRQAGEPVLAAAVIAGGWTGAAGAAGSACSSATHVHTGPGDRGRVTGGADAFSSSAARLGWVPPRGLA